MERDPIERDFIHDPERARVAGVIGGRAARGSAEPPETQVRDSQPSDIERSEEPLSGNEE